MMAVPLGAEIFFFTILCLPKMDLDVTSQFRLRFVRICFLRI